MNIAKINRKQSDRGKEREREDKNPTYGKFNEHARPLHNSSNMFSTYPIYDIILYIITLDVSRDNARATIRIFVSSTRFSKIPNYILTYSFADDYFDGITARALNTF